MNYGGGNAYVRLSRKYCLTRNVYLIKLNIALAYVDRNASVRIILTELVCNGNYQETSHFDTSEKLLIGFMAK